MSGSGPLGSYLRSDGAGWTSSALQASDLPDLGASYVKNGSVAQTGVYLREDGSAGTVQHVDLVA